MEYAFASYTDVGKRDNNEDALKAERLSGGLLAVVADGLGGHSYGEIASQLAVESIFRDLEEKQIDEETLIYAVLKANDTICTAENRGHTTAAALWMEDSCAVAAHVGDSRIYQFRDGNIIFQSVDHSVVQMAVLVGELAPDAVRHHKDRNKVFRVLGDDHEEPKVDSTELTVCPGDRFLLCSDGFWEPVTEADMLRTLRETETAQQWLDAMRQIVADARDPRQDNNTAICILVK